MLNIAAIVGRLGKDPEIKTTQSGKSVTSFSLAVQRGKKNQNGEYESDWIDVQAWGTTAEFICKYFTKGQMIAVTGSIQTRSYEDKQGNKRKAVEIMAKEVSFCGSKEAPKQERKEEPSLPDASDGWLDGDTDLPF